MADDDRCCVVAPGRPSVWCQREPGHEGKHSSTNGYDPIVVWADMPEELQEPYPEALVQAIAQVIDRHHMLFVDTRRILAERVIDTIRAYDEEHHG